ncbi:hypothetical protein ACER0C_003183 [Sarotherodon galilaeus]
MRAVGVLLCFSVFTGVFMEDKEAPRFQACLGLEVYEGAESVMLPCQVPEDVYRDATAVVWDRKDLSIPTVHLRLQSGDDLTKQNVIYFNRTSMRADALQTGDLSLTLRNPIVNDTGTYTCTTRRYGQDQSKTHLQLKVAERPPPGPTPPPVWPKVVSGVLVPVVLLAVGFGVFMYFRYKKLKNKEVVQVTAEPGDESVVLTCRSTVQPLPDGAKVEWKDRNERKVHVYQKDSEQAEKLHRRYRNRTEMKKDPQKTGDLSLTLKYPTNTDRDTYTCTVYGREGKELMEKQVELKIKECQVEVVEGVESVLLPFKTTENLPEDSDVEWKRHEPEYMKVYVYENGSDRPDKQDDHYRGRTEMKKDLLNTGDLSLTLGHPTVGDSGRYACEVNSKGAWRYKRVWLTVKGRDQVQDQAEDNNTIEMIPLMDQQSA